MAHHESIITPVLENIFSGRVCHDGEDQCDYDLTEQADFAPARGVLPEAFIPRLKKTVTYIVMAVIINSKNAVLMMQEAKTMCNGAWYLPAGKVEEGETLEEAVKREVLEETGLEMKPTTLLAVETARYWARFIFTGEIVGGKLKTLDSSDHHSLQAQWLLDEKAVMHRADDIKTVIELGRAHHQYKRQQKADPTSPSTLTWHADVLPAIKPHRKSLIQLVIVARSKNDNKMHVLVSEKNVVHLPTCELNPFINIHVNIRKFLMVRTKAYEHERKKHIVNICKSDMCIYLRKKTNQSVTIEHILMKCPRLQFRPSNFPLSSVPEILKNDSDL
ncbi:hypothetical protein WDU94_009784 [Cyamophila willieti]